MNLNRPNPMEHVNRMVSGVLPLCVLLCVACTDPIVSAPDDAARDPVDPVNAVAAPDGITQVDRPFAGLIEGLLHVFPPFAPGSDPMCNANFTGDPAAPGPAITVVDESEAWFSHLGHGRLVAVSCVDPLSPISSGSGFIEAANGDRITISFQNTSLPTGDPAILKTEGSQWVTGGTGRFVAATGTQWCSFRGHFVTPTTATITGECEGTIAYGGTGPAH
jgi:hypothetical protein